jgi:hypothetical protein
MSLNRMTLLLALLIACASPFPAAAQPPRTVPDNESGALGNSSGIDARWRETLSSFDEWAIIQRLYTKPQIAEMRAKILEKIADLPPEDSERFRDEVNTKLEVMMSGEARDARKWLNDTLAVASDKYAQKVRANLPDVVKESPSQLQADLDAFASRQTSAKQYQQGMEKTREMQIKALETNARRQAAANARARDNNVYNPAPGGAVIRERRPNYRYSSPYGPTSPYSIYPAYRLW